MGDVKSVSYRVYDSYREKAVEFLWLEREKELGRVLTAEESDFFEKTNEKAIDDLTYDLMTEDCLEC